MELYFFIFVVIRYHVLERSTFIKIMLTFSLMGYYI